VIPFTVRHVRDAPSDADQSVFTTMTAEFACVVVNDTDGAPAAAFAFADAPNPSEPRSTNTVYPNQRDAPPLCDTDAVQFVPPVPSVPVHTYAVQKFVTTIDCARVKVMLFPVGVFNVSDESSDPPTTTT
jgi:hypothetical protein